MNLQCITGIMRQFDAAGFAFLTTTGRFKKRILKEKREAGGSPPPLLPLTRNPAGRKEG
jgi:hypothetical protein